MRKKKVKICIGETMVSKEFNSDNTGSANMFEGRVVDRRRFGHFNLYMVQYEDGDTEEMYANEVRKCMVTYIDRRAT